jgi:hypothetical protein
LRQDCPPPHAKEQRLCVTCGCTPPSLSILFIKDMIDNSSSLAVVAAAWWQRGRQRGRITAAAAALLQRGSGGTGGGSAAAVAVWQQSRGGNRGVSMPVVASLAVAVAAWRQSGVSSSSIINNQLKAFAATATETVTMIATMTTINTKAMAAAAAAQRQHGGQCSRQHGRIAAGLWQGRQLYFSLGSATAAQ